MRIEISGQEKKEPEQVLRLRLVLESMSDGEEHAELVAVDENGETLPGGHLLKVCEDGVYRFPAVNSRIPVKKDRRERIAPLHE